MPLFILEKFKTEYIKKVKIENKIQNYILKEGLHKIE